MFTNVGSKLKTLAQIIAAVGIVGSILFGIIMMNNEIIVGIYVLIYGIVATVVLTFCLYGFGEIIKKVTKIAEDTSSMKKETCSGASEDAERLETLRKWNREGLITDEEYEQKKNRIINK